MQIPRICRRTNAQFAGCLVDCLSRHSHQRLRAAVSHLVVTRSIRFFTRFTRQDVCCGDGPECFVPWQDGSEIQLDPFHQTVVGMVGRMATRHHSIPSRPDRITTHRNCFFSVYSALAKAHYCETGAEGVGCRRKTQISLRPNNRKRFASDDCVD